MVRRSQTKQKERSTLIKGYRCKKSVNKIIVFVKVNALLDDASTKTYVNADVATEFGLTGCPQRVSVSVYTIWSSGKF